MNTDQYKQRLLAMEQELSTRFEQATANARESDDGAVGDTGDESVNDELKEEQFEEADIDWTTLNQVRDALKRIEDGTFGKCLVDGGPIEEERLKAIPWTPYCKKHQQLLEASSQTQTPSL